MIRIESIDDTPPVIRFRMARKILGRPYYLTAAYWVDDLLIDTGCAHTAPQLTSALESLHVSQIVNTHSHEDHIGANAGVQEVFGCPILAHPEALPILENPKLQPLQPYRRIFWGWPRPSKGSAIGEWVETERFRFQVVHTPGHSPDHICLCEPEQGWLFSGDAYIGGQDRALREGYDIHGIIASLKKLCELPVGMIFSGSGTVRTDGRRHLGEKVAYLEDLGERIGSLHKDGLSARSIRSRVLGRELPITYFTLGHFSGLRLVQSYLAGFEPLEPAQQDKQEDEGPESSEAAGLGLAKEADEDLAKESDEDTEEDV
jgi:glyoxylase-like metal-dependent hydrolase (beta-lactamase superfamily II)